MVLNAGHFSFIKFTPLGVIIPFFWRSCPKRVNSFGADMEDANGTTIINGIYAFKKPEPKIQNPIPNQDL